MKFNTNGEFLLTINITDLINWLNENPSMTYHYIDHLMKRMSEIYQSIPQDETFNKLLHALYIDRKDVCEIEFNLLEEAMLGIVSHLGYDHIPFSREVLTKHKYLYLHLLFISSYDITNNLYQFSFIEDATEYFYNVIMDVYIPSDNPDKIVKSVVANYTLKEFLEHAHDTQWFTDKYKEYELDESIPLKEALLLFKYISDIYTNRGSKIEFFLKLHDLICTGYRYMDCFNMIENRYYEYFRDDTINVIGLLASLIRRINENDISDDVVENMLKYRVISKYHSSVPLDVFKCLMNDVAELCKSVYLLCPTITARQRFYDIFMTVWNSDLGVINEYDYGDEEECSLSYLDKISQIDTVTEAVHNDSPVMNEASKKIYKAYRNYKSAEEKVDSQVSKALTGIKGVLTGDVRSEIIEGKKFSAIGLLKKLLGTVAIFSYSKIAGVVTIVVSYALKKNTRISERRKIIMELETEIKLIDEKINDARGDDNRDAKYSMMRTKAELENALKKIRYGLEADTRSLSSAKATLNNVRNN